MFSCSALSAAALGSSCMGLMDSLTRGSHICKTVLVAVLIQWQLRDLLEEQNRFARGGPDISQCLDAVQCLYNHMQVRNQMLCHLEVTTILLLCSPPLLANVVKNSDGGAERKLS